MAVLVSAGEFSTFLGIPLPASDSLQRNKMEMLLTWSSEWARELSQKPWLLPADAPFTARGIILAACRREWNNPKRVSYVVKGPQSATFMQQAYPPGFFSEAEEARLRGYARRGGDLWTFETYREEPEIMNGYLEIDPNGGLMPVYNPYDYGGYDDSIHP